mgnify:CR=1 FL=1
MKKEIQFQKEFLIISTLLLIKSSSIVIFKVSGGASNFIKYRNLKGSKRQVYLTENRTTPTELDYSIGTLTLYFAKKANDKNSKVFQISKEDYKRHTPMYSKIPLTLFIYGERNDIEYRNFRRINVANSRLRGVENAITPLEFFRPVNDKKEDVEERIKNRITAQTTQPEITSIGLPPWMTNKKEQPQLQEQEEVELY